MYASYDFVRLERAFDFIFVQGIEVVFFFLWVVLVRSPSTTVTCLGDKK